MRDRDDHKGPVIGEPDLQAAEPMVRIRWSQSGAGWRRVAELRSAFAVGWQVQHVPLERSTASLGVGRVEACRTLGGCDQVLVQFFESGESRWLPFQLLKRVKPVEERLRVGDVGPYPDHAERFRLRVLAHALRAWDENTGALGRLDIDPLPHQIHVAHRVVSSGSANWLIADDVGLGKTIEVGLILHALAQRNQARRVLVVCPAGLTRQWQDELRYKFDQWFEIYGRDFFVRDPPLWRLHDKVIISLDLAKRAEMRELLLAAGSWDVVIFDEAHRLGRSESGERTDRYRLAEALRPMTPSMLLLTATPHQGKTRRFAALLELVRPDLSEEIRTLDANPEIVTQIVIRNRKTKVTDASGTPIFNGHDTHRIQVEPSKAARQFDDRLQRYLRHGYALSGRAGIRGRAIGFVMTTYRKLASSSIAAITRALELRLERLRARHGCETSIDESIESQLEAAELDPDELADQPLLFDQAAFFDDEAAQLEELLGLAQAARDCDDKLGRFLDEVARPLLARGDKLLVFTEYRATQRYLTETLCRTLPELEEPALIHGSMTLEEKIENVRRFNHGNVRLLISTEAGGEGLNLQRSCYVMVNYDLPWNPSRLVQRIGRLYRYGQIRRVVVFNLQTRDSFDNSAIALMMERVETMARDLAVVAGERRETIEAEILGQLLEYVDLEAILARSTGLRIELTATEIDAALEQARQARDKQDEILAFADAYAGRLGGSAGVDLRHVRSFVEGMLPFAGIRAAGTSHQGRALEIDLPEDLVGKFPEFGRRKRVSVTFDRKLARDRLDFLPVDFQNSFFQFLIDLARQRAFDGLFGAISRPWREGWLSIYYSRWQDALGRPLEDDLLAFHCDPEGATRRVEPQELGELLLEALTSKKAPVPPPDLPVAHLLGDAAEQVISATVDRTRQPSTIFMLAATGS